MVKNKALILGSAVVLLISLALVAGCIPGEVPEGEGTDPWMLIVFLVLIFVVFYFLMIRPQRKRQKEHQQMVDELKRGDRVITAGGIHGAIESISEENVIIKIESGATMRVAKRSVSLKQES